MVGLRKRCSSLTPETSARPVGVRRMIALALLGTLGSGTSLADPDASSATGCLPDGSGYLQAKLAGAIDAELDWDDGRTECSGSSRPNDGGLRIVFRRPAATDDEDALVMLFGIGDVAEG